ncbi:MAG: hypothetical protein LBI33_12775 [Propionibacteriaceae bacterium]|jgi:hypothetical protein|nr:hypothetical protein [Propionibacteriaceae bacterium]
MSGMLFDGYPDPPRPPGPTGSPGQRPCARQQATIQQGAHPLNARGLYPGQTCGTCVHRFAYQMASRAYPKCEYGPLSHGPKTDVKASWPACDLWEGKRGS